MTFDGDELLQTLVKLSEDRLDQLPYGVVVLQADNIVETYNACEERHSGLPRSTVIGRNFFVEVAPCMNNYLVCELFEDVAHLDVIMPYVLTFRMRPTPVRLRLMRAASSPKRWVLVERDKRGA